MGRENKGEKIRIYSRRLFIYRDKIREIKIGATDLRTFSRKTGIPLNRCRYWFEQQRREYFENDEIQITVIDTDFLFNKNSK